VDGEDGAFDIAAYWLIILKHRWTIISVLVSALVLGAVVTLLTKPTYTSKITLQIDREAEKVVSREDVTPSDNRDEEFFQTQYGLLKSRALAERVGETLGLMNNDAFEKTMRGRPPPASESANLRRDNVVRLLQTHQDVLPERGSRLVTVGFRSPDPSLSARIANSFGESFIAAGLDRRFESSSYARDFLAKRLEQVKAKLEESERALVAYAASQGIVQLTGDGHPGDPQAGQSLAGANLETFNASLAAARTERIKAQERWNQAQTAGVGLTEILQSPTIQAISQEHAKLLAEYQDKLRIFKPAYPDMLQLKARVDETGKQLDIEADNIRAALKGQYLAALANERALEAQVSGSKSAVMDLRSRSIRYTILQREVDTNRTLYDGLLQRYKEVGVAGGVSPNNISIVDRAEPPRRPSAPRPVMNMLLAGLGGLSLGVLLAFVREALDQAVRSPEDVERILALPLLGAVPQLKRGVQPKEALADPRSPISEAYHSLRSALQFSTADGFPKTLLVTSALPGCGKSTTAYAISHYLARLGFRVLIVDADLRKPGLRNLFGADDRLGLTHILTGSASLRDATQATESPNLFLVTSGPPPPNPAEILAGSRLSSLVAEAAGLFDMVIFDGPPVVGLADAPMMGAVVVGTLLVVEANRTTRVQEQTALRRMTRAGANILGVLLTRHNPTHSHYGYGHGYAYGAGENITQRAPVKEAVGFPAIVRRVRQLGSDSTSNS
jgi:capsular exopolysaccharide synthesis family protein